MFTLRPTIYDTHFRFREKRVIIYLDTLTSSRMQIIKLHIFYWHVCRELISPIFPVKLQNKKPLESANSTTALSFSKAKKISCQQKRDTVLLRSFSDNSNDDNDNKKDSWILVAIRNKLINCSLYNFRPIYKFSAKFVKTLFLVNLLTDKQPDQTDGRTEGQTDRQNNTNEDIR